MRSTKRTKFRGDYHLDLVSSRRNSPPLAPSHNAGDEPGDLAEFSTAVGQAAGWKHGCKTNNPKGQSHLIPVVEDRGGNSIDPFGDLSKALGKALMPDFGQGFRDRGDLLPFPGVSVLQHPLGPEVVEIRLGKIREKAAPEGPLTHGDGLTDGYRDPERILSLHPINDDDLILESLTQETRKLQLVKEILQEGLCHRRSTGGRRGGTPEFDQTRPQAVLFRPAVVGHEAMLGEGLEDVEARTLVEFQGPAQLRDPPRPVVPILQKFQDPHCTLYRWNSIFHHSSPLFVLPTEQGSDH